MKIKKLFILLFLLICITVAVMSYLEIGFFAPIPISKYDEDDIIELDDLERDFGSTPNPLVRNPDVVPDTNFDSSIMTGTDLLIPIVEHRANEENLNYIRCLDCNYKESNPEICEDHNCNPLGDETHTFNYFFCDNPYVDGWDPSTFTITDIPESYPSNLGNGNNNYYNIFRCLDKYKKDLVRNNNTCEELLNKSRNTSVINDFISSLPQDVKDQLQSAINRPNDPDNGIPDTGNTIDDYVLHNRYIQSTNPGFSGFRDTWGEQLDQIERDYFSEEVDSIFATCFGIETAPSPDDISCPLDNLGLTPPEPTVPIQTPSVLYGSLDSQCETSKTITSSQQCSDAYFELSNQYPKINPISYNTNSKPRGCGLLNGSDLIYNGQVSGSPHPSVVPLCRR